MRNNFYALIIASLILTSCQPEAGSSVASTSKPTTSSTDSAGNFFEQLGEAVKQGVQQGMDNGIQTSGAVGVLGYAMMPSKLTGRNEPAYCLDNPATHKLITVAPMFGRPYTRGDGTVGFMQTTKQRSEHTHNVEVNLNGILPGQTCVDLINSQKLTPGIAPDYYY